MYRGSDWVAPTRTSIASEEKRAPSYPDKVSTDLPDLWPDWDPPAFR